MPKMSNTLRKLTGVPRGRSTMTMPKSKKYKRRALTRLKQVSSRLGLSSPPSCSSSLFAILVTLSALSLTLLAFTRTKSDRLDTSTCFDILLWAASLKNRLEQRRSGKLLAGYLQAALLGPRTRQQKSATFFSWGSRWSDWR